MNKSFKLESNSSGSIPIINILFISLTYISRIIEEVFYGQDTQEFSIVFLAFIPFSVYTILVNFEDIGMALFHKIVLLLGVFILSAFLIESFHTDSAYREIRRTILMAISIPLFAIWIYKDIRYLMIMSIIFMVYSLIHSLNLSLTISIAEMLSIGNADQARGLIYEKAFFSSNSNGVCYLAGTSLIICYIIYSYYTISNFQRNLLITVSLIFFYTCLLTLSRSGILNLVFLLLIVYFYSNIKPNIFLVSIFLTFLTFYLAFSTDIIDLLFSRFDTVTLNEDEAMDSRAILYIKVLKNIDEVFLIGVGEGNYFGEWGKNSDFGRTLIDEFGEVTERVTPTHNSFAQLLFYWGIIPIIIYAFIQYYLFTTIPKEKTDMYNQIVIILFFSSFSLILFSNNFNAKDFSFIYGAIVGLSLRKLHHRINV